MKKTFALLAATTLTKSARSLMTTITTTERTFTCSDGVKLVVKSWSNSRIYESKSNGNENVTTKKILCLHGWLDNAASFNRLAPLLLDSSPSIANQKHKQQPVEIFALDFPGHGLSGHKSVDGPPQLLAEVSYSRRDCFDYIIPTNTYVYRLIAHATNFTTTFVFSFIVW